MKKTVYLVGMLMLASACVSEWGDNVDTSTPLIEQINITDDFSFQTTEELLVEVTALDNGDEPLSNVAFTIYYVIDTTIVEQATGTTQENGKTSFSLSKPSFVESLVIKTQYPGLTNEKLVSVQSGLNKIVFGGKEDNKSRKASPLTQKPGSTSRTKASGLSYLSTYNSNGVPDNLEPDDDYISQDLLDMINATLPESYPVPVKNSEYLKDNIITDIQLQDSATIWITFVHEGAGYRNALGFYTYDLNNPPQTLDDIEDLTIIFPNASFLGSGGGLISGNKVKLGSFTANTGIGWFLVPDAWNGSVAVDKPEKKFSNKIFNTYTSEKYRQHTVLLKDEAREIILLGMEDITRPAGDNDFNDAIFYITANPFEALITDNLETTKTSGNDADNDGVSDNNDAYPDDPTIAFNTYSPGKDTYGSIAFEDNWPAKGDYDMNDIVINYNYQFVTNTSNKVVRLIGKYSLVATGATYDNGFGLELPIPTNKVNSVSIENSSSRFNINDMEPGQENLVMILFDDAHAMMNSQSIVNTIPDKEFLNPIDFSFEVIFNEPILLSDLGSVPFNPFIFVDGDRSREVHLPGKVPTMAANHDWFGEQADTSDPALNRFYKSETNLPWAIHLPVTFEYPIEFSAINLGHLKFARWAESSGGQFQDWYKNNSGYRNQNKIYKK